ncbi:MAG: type II toxin-antitoxin system RelE/ParE family toxin [Candidatus Woesebacteria bacterium]
MARLIWTNPALADLQAIAEYIELDNPVAAAKLVQKIFSTALKLQNFPKLGKIPIEARHASYKEIVIQPCRLFYRLENNSVYIVFITRMERDASHFRM